MPDCYVDLLLLQIRPLTHDLMKNMLQDIGYRVTKVSQHQHSAPQHSSPDAQGSRLSTPPTHMLICPESARCRMQLPSSVATQEHYAMLCCADPAQYSCTLC
jgi:hypothetical protein